METTLSGPLFSCLAFAFFALGLYFIVLMMDRFKKLQWMSEDRKKALALYPDLPPHVTMCILKTRNLAGQNHEIS